MREGLAFGKFGFVSKLIATAYFGNLAQRRDRR
jgi:hypothetical protein